MEAAHSRRRRSSAPAQLRQHVAECSALRQDLAGIVDDWRRKARDGVTVRYAIDHSEIHAYVFPDRSAGQLKIFSSDPITLATGIQHYALDRMFFHAEHKPILLPPYILELRSFAEYVSHLGTASSVAAFPEATDEATRAIARPEFQFVDQLVSRIRDGARPSDAELGMALKFFEQHAATLIRLLDQAETVPLNRLNFLLEGAAFEPIGAIVNGELPVDEAAVADREHHLAVVRAGRRDPEAPSPPPTQSDYFDAVAMAMLNAANEALRPAGQQIRLVTRSTAMRKVEKDFAGATTESTLLRHPRAFIALRRVEGLESADDALHRLELMLGALAAVEESYGKPADAAPSEAPANGRSASGALDDRDSIQDLIDDVRENLHFGANLASMIAVSRSDLTQRKRKVDEPIERIIRLFNMVHRSGELLTAVEDQISVLAENVDRTQQLLGWAIQGQAQPLSAGESFHFEERREGAVMRLNRDWMPYTLDFRDERSRNWSRDVLEHGGVTNREMLELVQAGFSAGLDYEMMLYLAYILGAWDRWDLALKYCDMALDQQALEKRIPPHEGKFFKAVCLRKAGEQTAETFRDALSLLDEARAIKSRTQRGRDARYLKEQATLLFVWADAERATGDPTSTSRAKLRTKQALKLSIDALREVGNDDAKLRMHIYNSLCYYYASHGEESDLESVRIYLALLEEGMANTQPDDWPLEFVDTMLVAHCRLHDQGLHAHEWNRLIDILAHAARTGHRTASEERVWSQHVRDARRLLTQPPPEVVSR